MKNTTKIQAQITGKASDSMPCATIYEKHFKYKKVYHLLRLTLSSDHSSCFANILNWGHPKAISRKIGNVSIVEAGEIYANPVKALIAN